MGMMRRSFAVAFVSAVVVAFPAVSSALRTIHGANCTTSASSASAAENGFSNTSAQDIYCPLVDDFYETNDSEVVAMVCDKSTTTQISAQLCSMPLSGAAINCSTIRPSTWSVLHKGPEDIRFGLSDNPFGTPSLGPGYVVVKTPSNGGTVYGVCVGFNECQFSPAFGHAACPN